MTSTTTNEDSTIRPHDHSRVDMDHDTTTLLNSPITNDKVSTHGIDPVKIQLTESEPQVGYYSQRAEPPKPARSPTLRTQADVFKDALRSYQQTCKDPQIKAFNLEGKHSWDEVLRLVKDNKALYEAAGKRPWRRMGRFLGRQAENVHPWLRLIPNNDTASIAAIHIKEGQEEVLTMLLNVPDIILEGEHALENFGNDLALSDKVEELNIAILKALGSAVDLLQKHPLHVTMGKQDRALRRGQNYNRPFREKVEEVERALGALQARADFLRDADIVHTRTTTNKIHVIVREVQRSNDSIDHKSERTLHHILELKAVAQELKLAAEQQGKDIHDLQSGQTDTWDRVNDEKRRDKEINKALELNLQTAQYRDNGNRVLRRMQKQLRGVQVAIHRMTEADLLRILDYDDELVLEDFRIVHEQCQSRSITAADYKVAQGVLESAPFTKWLTGPESSGLFIERKGSPASPNAFSPVSIMSGSVVEEVGHNQSACVVYHFCCLHAAHGDDKCGPQGLLRSIIFQVLQHFPQRINAGFISRREARDQLESRDIRSLCHWLAGILSQLPPETVIFCIMDSIDAFETGTAWRIQCKHMMREFLDIVHDDESYPVFKLLLTSSARSREISDVFPNEMRLFLLADGAGGRDNPTERDISLGARRPKATESDSYRRLKAQMRWSEEDTADSGTDWSSDGD